MKEIKNILICGAGMMGKNIGYVFASNPSFQVGMYDLYPTDVEAGIRTNTRQLLDKGVITEQELSDRLSRISFTNDIDSDLVKNADLVIEAVFEDMKIKRETFAKLEARCRPDTIFCTNSSVMSPSEISAELKHRERFVGTHFWNPGHLIPLVEVVKSDASSDEVAQTVMEVLRSVGKKPVLCKKGRARLHRQPHAARPLAGGHLHRGERHRRRRHRGRGGALLLRPAAAPARPHGERRHGGYRPDL